MNKKIRRPSTVTAPFGFMATQESKKFGYLRIAKCGSTSFSSIKEFSLDQWVEIAGFRGGECYSALRDPVDRFFSSIPETMKRFTKNTNPIDGRRDVVVSWDIYEEILKLDIENWIPLSRVLLRLLSGTILTHTMSHKQHIYTIPRDRHIAKI